MNRRAIAAIVRKDLTVVSRSRPVMVPIIGLPSFLLITMPIAIAVTGRLVQRAANLAASRPGILDNVPQRLAEQITSSSAAETLILFGMGHLMMPMFLMVPMLVASVIASDSFAGEKERKTLEALLYTPITDRELYVAKLLPAWLVSQAVGLGGFVVYMVVANASAWPVLGRVFLPNVMWLVLAFWLAPAVSGLALGATVLISSKVRGFQEAYQLSGIIVLPLTFLFAGQAMGAVASGPLVAMAMGAVFWLIDGLLFWLGANLFRRDSAIIRQ